jgi:lipid-A-disaccharide synthase
MRLLVSALEPSSNLHLKEILKHTEDIELFGIFDSSLGNPHCDTTQLAVMGVVDAIKKLRWFLKLADEMVKIAKDVDKILLMDSSGFNLPLAKKLKQTYPNKEIIYYILPQVWASRPKRVKRLELYCDHLLGILPFEVEFYSDKARYIGHPLLDEIKLSKKRVSLQNHHKTIAYLPGSRRAEITKLMPIYKEVNQRLFEHKALLVIPPSFSDKQIELLYGDIDGFELCRDTHKALYRSDFAYICSGTATLESALIGTPFTLNYIAKKVDFLIATKLLGIKQVGLANIILTRYNGTTLHNELLQESVTVDNLLEEYYNSDPKIFAKKAKELKEYLKYGSSQNVAKVLLEEIIC